MYITSPTEIEKRSFEIIGSELGEKSSEFTEDELPVIKRVIHTTADFGYADITEFTEDAVAKGKAALLGGCKIYCDTKMIQTGLSAAFLEKLGCTAYTLISDAEVAKEAAQRGVTRAIVSMERAMRDSDTKIFLIGNAPTALFTLIEGIKNGITSPELIVGVPVGFVGAAESKAALDSVKAEFIRTNGRKGGSTVAVAILHGIAYQLGKRE